MKPRCLKACQCPSGDGFTRLDLIAVVAVVLVLCHSVSWAGARNRSRGAICQNNHRQLVAAWFDYADSNAGRLIGNLDGVEVQSLANSNRTWALGWMDFNGGSSFPASHGGRANTNTIVLSQLSPLAPLLGRRSDVFKCPEDASLSLGRAGLPRVRSVSMNAHLGERQRSTAGYRQFTRLEQIGVPSPAALFVFMDEREDSINDGLFGVDMSGSEPEIPELKRIIDYPADWHNRGANLSFADGHVETWKWVDPRTTPPHRLGQLLALSLPSPGNQDVARIQAASTTRLP